MSGGSFDYLFIKTPCDLVRARDVLAAMAKTIATYPGHEAAKADAEALLAEVDRAAPLIDAIESEAGESDRCEDELLAERFPRLADLAANLTHVFKAVEWHCSLDSRPDSVAEALTAYARS